MHALRSRLAKSAAGAGLLALFVSAGVSLIGRSSLHQNVWPSIAAGYLAVSAFYSADAVRRYIPPVVALLPLAGWALYQVILWITAAVVGAFTLPFLAAKALVEAQRINQLSVMVQKRLRPPASPRILSVRVE